jgi:hypothetical protein
MKPISAAADSRVRTPATGNPVETPCSSPVDRWAKGHAAGIEAAALSFWERRPGIKSCEFPAISVFARSPSVTLPTIWHKRCMVK